MSAGVVKVVVATGAMVSVEGAGTDIVLCSSSSIRNIKTADMRINVVRKIALRGTGLKLSSSFWLLRVFWGTSPSTARC